MVLGNSNTEAYLLCVHCKYPAGRLLLRKKNNKTIKKIKFEVSYSLKFLLLGPEVCLPQLLDMSRKIWLPYYPNALEGILFGEERAAGISLMHMKDDSLQSLRKCGNFKRQFHD